MAADSASALGRTPAGHPAPTRQLVSTKVLWFGIFAGPATWSVQTIANYAAFAHSCFPADVPLRSPAIDGVRAIGLVVSVVALVLTLVALAAAVRAWRGTERRAPEAREPREANELFEVGEGRARFMAFAGILVSVLFTYAILMNAVPLVTRPVCQ
jgi:hypothetical protein